MMDKLIMNFHSPLIMNLYLYKTDKDKFITSSYILFIRDILIN